MTLSNQVYKNTPEYYRTMYLDGYTPEQIMYAARKKFFKEIAEHQEQENKIDEIKIVSEVKVK